MSPREARRVRGLERTLIRQIFDAAPADAIQLGLGQPDLPTPDAVRLAGIAAIAAGRTGYTTTAGLPELREAIAREHAPFVSGPEQVCVHVGSQEAFFAAVMALVDPGDELLVPDPGYPGYPAVAHLAGAEARPYPLSPERGFRLDADEVERRLTDRTRAVVLCSPGNPTGAVHAAAEVERLVSALEQRGVAWISDEIYAGLAYEGGVPSPSRFSRDGGLIVSGLSKTFSMTGWRVGWVAGPRSLVRRITAVHQYLVTCAPRVSQTAALAAFTPQGRIAAERQRRRFERRRRLMADELSRVPGLRFDAPAGAFYFFVDARRYGTDSVELSRRILERGNVVTVPGVAFGPGGEGFLRLSFAADEEDITRGVRAIGRVLRSG